MAEERTGKEQEEDTHNGLPKYRYLEEFEENIDPETGLPYEGIGSPMLVGTELFGKRLLHRIAKIDWQECKVKQVFSNGKEDQEREYSIYEEHLGEIGGWVESKDNLAQHGKSWIKDGAVVLDEAHVSGDATIDKEVEIGGYARVSGSAEVSGPTGITGDCAIFGKAKIIGKRDKDGKKVFSVYDEASVEGEVSGGGKVYGEATIGKDGKVTNEAEVYGEAFVDGEVTDKSLVFGRAEVHGLVSKSQVDGTAVIGKDGTVKGEDTPDGDLLMSYVHSGNVDGELVRTYVSGILRVGKGSHIERCFLGGDRASVNGGITQAGIFEFGKDCYVFNCDLMGIVKMENSTAKYCKIADSVLKSSTIEECYVIRSILDSTEASGEKKNRLDKQIGAIPDPDLAMEVVVTFQDAVVKKGKYHGDGSLTIDPKQIEYLVSDDSDLGFHIETGREDTTKFLPKKMSIVGGIPPEGAEWRNVGLSGVTNVKIATEITLGPRIAKIEDQNLDAKLIPRKYNIYSYDHYYYEYNSSSETEELKSKKIEGVYRNGNGPAPDDYSVGIEAYEGIEVLSKRTNKWKMDEWVKEKEEEEKEWKEKEEKISGRIAYVESKLASLAEKADQYYESALALENAKSFDAADKTREKAHVCEYAGEVIRRNKTITDVHGDTDGLWDKKKSAIDSTSGSVGSSVTPHFAYTMLHATTDPTEENPYTKFEGDESKGYELHVPDFTKPKTLPSITGTYPPDYNEVYVVSDFLESIIEKSEYSEGLASLRMFQKGDVSGTSSFADLIRYTEILKYGKEKLEEYWEKKENGDSSDSSDE